jgi:hypothetical protein
MKTFLSWDCAIRSLAHIHLTVNFDIMQSLYDSALLLSAITDINEMTVGIQNMLLQTDQFITIHSLAVKDLLEGKKVADCDEITRTRYLAKHLRELQVDPDCKVLIEHQPSRLGMASNNKSTHISAQLAYHYIDHQPYLVDPRLKNKISIGDHSFDKYLGSCATAYSARKKHTKQSLIYFFTLFNIGDKITHIKKSNLDDLADAFFQVFGYIKFVR